MIGVPIWSYLRSRQISEVLSDTDFAQLPSYNITDLLKRACILILTSISIVDVNVAHRSKRGFFKNVFNGIVGTAVCIRKYESIIICEKLFWLKPWMEELLFYGVQTLYIYNSKSDKGH